MGNRPNSAKKRENKRKAKRLQSEQAKTEVRKAYQARRTHTHLVMGREDEELVIAFRPGTYGHPRTILLRIPHLDIVGAHEEPRDFGALLAKVGMLCLAGLCKYDLSEGTDGILKALTKWACIDLEELKKGVTVDEDGDLEIRSPELPPEAAPGLQADLAPGLEASQ